MSRVHCLECGGPVVLDPSGVCPEGHHVGASGARVEQAMGFETAHPDEPEPWVYRIEPSELTLVGAGRNGAAQHSNGSGPREARPVRLPSFDPDADGGSDAESLLRELHSLAAFDQQQATQPAPARTNGVDADSDHAGATTTSPPPLPTTANPTPTRAPRPDPDAIAEAFAELSALDAPDAAMTPRPSANGRAQRGTPDPTSNGSSGGPADGARIDEDELASLFDPPPSPSPAAPPSAEPGAQAGPPPAPTTPPEPPRPAAPTPGATAAGHTLASATDVPETDQQPAVSAEHLGGDADELDLELHFGDAPVTDDVADPHGAAATTDTPGARATSDDGEPRGPGASTDADDAPGPDTSQGRGDDQRPEDLDTLLQDLSGDDGLFGGFGGAAGPAPGAPGAPGTDDTTPTATPAPQPAPPTEDTSPPAPASSPTQEQPRPAAPPDLSSFTAKGGSSSRGGKRRRFGR